MVRSGCAGQHAERLRGNKLSRETARILKLPDVSARLADLGAESVGSTPEQFSAHIKAEIAKWAKVIRDANVELQSNNTCAMIRDPETFTILLDTLRRFVRERLIPAENELVETDEIPPRSSRKCARSACSA